VSETGLTSEQARTRLEAEGPNALPESDRRSGLRVIGEVLREPMLVLLILNGRLAATLNEPISGNPGAPPPVHI